MPLARYPTLAGGAVFVQMHDGVLLCRTVDNESMEWPVAHETGGFRFHPMDHIIARVCFDDCFEINLVGGSRRLSFCSRFCALERTPGDHSVGLSF